MEFVAQPMGALRLGDYLISNFREKRWSLFRASVAFVKNSGVKHLYSLLFDFRQHANIKISVGIDSNVTTYEGLVNLLDAIGSQSELWIFHNENSSSFHPKVYLFANSGYADLVVGSGNLTEGGLFTNYEAFIHVELDLQNIEHLEQYNSIIQYLDYWAEPSTNCAIQATTEFLENLKSNNYLPTEEQVKRQRREQVAQAYQRVKTNSQFKPFGRNPVPPAPHQPPIPIRVPEFISGLEEPNIPTLEPTEGQDGLFKGFVMTLQQTDVGYGQTTVGKSRRSPEIFIPLKARDKDPIFWGWRALFKQDVNNPIKYDRWGVNMLVRGNLEVINMMTWPIKHDFRLRSEALRRGAKPGDILKIERSDGTAGYQYTVEIISTTAPDYQFWLARCDQDTGRPNSKKRWGYY